MILSEFVGQLEGAARLMEIGLRKKPRLVCLWANRWGKHRLQILLQHHPLMAFADQYGDNWAEVEERLRTEPLTDPCGNSQPVRIIDPQWIEVNYGNRLSHDANAPGRALVVVPPLAVFLDETIGYFRDFVEACLKMPEFESVAYVRCP
jgi:hypothetical protein